MIRRLIGLGAITLASVSFWFVCTKFGEFVDFYCPDQEARGNCEARYAEVLRDGSLTFILAMVVLTMVVVLPKFKRGGSND
jgi:hypothetical protein